MSKPFCELTKDEATTLVEQIVDSANSESQARLRLTEKGFNGVDAVIIPLQRVDGWFDATVIVPGPNGEILIT
jgi:hypothetical protein